MPESIPWIYIQLQSPIRCPNFLVFEDLQMLNFIAKTMCNLPHCTNRNLVKQNYIRYISRICPLLERERVIENKKYNKL